MRTSKKHLVSRQSYSDYLSDDFDLDDYKDQDPVDVLNAWIKKVRSMSNITKITNIGYECIIDTFECSISFEGVESTSQAADRVRKEFGKVIATRNILLNQQVDNTFAQIQILKDSITNDYVKEMLAKKFLNASRSFR